MKAKLSEIQDTSEIQPQKEILLRGLTYKLLHYIQTSLFLDPALGKLLEKYM